MKTSLSKLSMRDYIELMCGDTSVLLGRGEFVSPSKLSEVRRKLMYAYHEMSDGAGSKALLLEYEARQRALATLTLCQVLSNLMALGATDDVRAILREHGNRREYDDKALAVEVETMLGRAKTEVKRTERPDRDVREPTEKEIRGSFDRQTASLMTYFKFQINLDVASASQYACMVEQANKEIKAKMAAMAKR